MPSIRLNNCTSVKLKSESRVLGGRTTGRKENSTLEGCTGLAALDEYTCVVSVSDRTSELAFLSQDCDISRYFPFCCSDRKGRAFLFSLSPNIIHENKTKHNTRSRRCFGGTCGCVLSAICRKMSWESFLPRKEKRLRSEWSPARRFNKPNRTWLRHKPNTAARIVAREVSSQTEFL